MVLTPNDFEGKVKKGRGSYFGQRYQVFPDLTPKQYLKVLDRLKNIADCMSASSLPKCYCCVDDVMVLFDWNGIYDNAVCLDDPFHFNSTATEMIQKAENPKLKIQIQKKAMEILKTMISLYEEAESCGFETHGYTSKQFKESETKPQGPN